MSNRVSPDAHLSRTMWGFRFERAPRWLHSTGLVLCGLLLAFADAAAQSLPSSMPPGVDIHIEARPQTATVGDRIQFDVDISLPRGYQARLPEPGDQLGDFTILEFLPGLSVPEADTPGASGLAKDQPTSSQGETHHKARIVAAVYEAGHFDFPPLPVVLLAPDGKRLTLSTPTVKIVLESVLTEENPSLKGLKKQAEIQEPMPWLFLALLPLILAAIAWLVWQRHRRAAPPVSIPAQADPLARAEAELRTLLGRRLLENGLVKQFYVLLSEIVKAILAAGHGIQTTEKTTSEIVHQLHDSTVHDVEKIESLLFACDLVKFAKYLPSQVENEAAIEKALQILEICKKASSAPVVAETTPAEGAA